MTELHSTAELDRILIEGPLDALAVEELRPTLEALTLKSSETVEVNLMDVDFIDSSGIGAIVFLFKRLQVEKRTMRITGAHGQPLDLLRHLRIDKSIPVSSES